MTERLRSHDDVDVLDVACIHGLGGTSATVEPIAAPLRAHGWYVETPLLPGHGTQPEDLIGVTWERWLAAIPRARVLIGQSMGGSLALAAAATQPAADAVVCINALGYDDPDAVLDGDWIDVGVPDIRASGVSEAAYRRIPVSALREMSRGVGSLRLEAVTVPILVVTSADDAVVDPYHSDVIATSVAGPVERLRLLRSGHVATLDLDARLLVEAVTDFVSRALSRPR